MGRGFGKDNSYPNNYRVGVNVPASIIFKDNKLLWGYMMSTAELVQDELQKYRFEYGPNKITPQLDIKRHNSVTKAIWRLLKGYDYPFFLFSYLVRK